MKMLYLCLGDDAAGDPRAGEVVDDHGTAQDVRGTKTRRHGHVALGIGACAVVPHGDPFCFKSWSRVA